MQSLVAAIAARLDPGCLHPGQPVTRVERQDNCWLVTIENTANHTGAPQFFRAQHLVLAAPPRKLIQIPGLAHCLPAGLSQALATTPTWMAAQAKFVAVYPEPFWRQAGLSGQVFSRVGPMVEIHDASASTESGFALFGFIGVPAGVRHQHADDRLTSACLNQLVSVFSARAAAPDLTWLKDWAQDTWVVSDSDLGGSPIHPDLDLSRWLPQLQRLQLYFIGSEVAVDEGGYLEGALGSVETLMQLSGVFS